jgi:fused-like protein
LVKFHRELNFDGANQSLRIIKNLIEAGSYHSCAAIDDIISMLLEFTTLIIRMKLSAAYSLAVKVFTSDTQNFIFT